MAKSSSTVFGYASLVMSAVRSIHSRYRFYACLALYSSGFHLQLHIICAGTWRTRLRHDSPEHSSIPVPPCSQLHGSGHFPRRGFCIDCLPSISFQTLCVTQVSIASPPSKTCAGILPSAKSFSSLAISARLLAAWIAARILLFSSSV
jgi:hypothetical protein